MSGLSISVPVDVDATVTVDPDHGHIFTAVFRAGESEVTLTGSWRELVDLAGSMLGQLNAQEPDDLKLGDYVAELNAMRRARLTEALGRATRFNYDKEPRRLSLYTISDLSKDEYEAVLRARAVSEPDPPSLESRRDFGHEPPPAA